MKQTIRVEIPVMPTTKTLEFTLPCYRKNEYTVFKIISANEMVHVSRIEETFSICKYDYKGCGLEKLQDQKQYQFATEEEFNSLFDEVIKKVAILNHENA